MGSWGVSLENIYLSGGSNSSENILSGCSEQTVVGCLTAPPSGLGLPGRRVEDVTFVQRDGVKHYSDWYESRIITLERVVVCDEGCGSTDPIGSVRQKVQDLLQAWSRTCCDTELVIYTPQYNQVYESSLAANLLQQRINYFNYNSLGQDYSSNCGVFEFSNSRGFGAGADGVYSQYTEITDLPANLPAPQSIARKTWTSQGVSRCRDYTPGRCYTTVSPPVTGFMYDNISTGSNDGAGFIMGCGGVSAYPVSLDETYTISGYMRSSINDVNLLVRVFYYNASGALISTDEGAVINSTMNTWHRPYITTSVPVDAVTMQFALDTGAGGTVFGVGDTLDASAVLVEKTNVLNDYFDGSFTDSDDYTLGGEKVSYTWDGGSFASVSRRSLYTYVAGRDRALNGPFGIIGRPRVAEVEWASGGFPCATVLLRFDAVDHRINVLDDCGTPGYTECVTLSPGSTSTGRLYPKCYDTAPTNSYCYDSPVPGSTFATTETARVIGTQTVYPVITLNPSLTNPRIEDITTGKTISYQGTIRDGEEPVIIYTEDFTAYQGTTSVSHLIGGTLDFSFTPGAHDLRAIISSEDDTGSVSICWRPAVVSA